MYKSIRQKKGNGVHVEGNGKSIDVVVVSRDKESGLVCFNVSGSDRRKKVEFKTKGRREKRVALAEGLSLNTVPESNGGSTIVVSCRNGKYHLWNREYDL